MWRGGKGEGREEIKGNEFSAREMIELVSVHRIEYFSSEWMNGTK